MQRTQVRVVAEGTVDSTPEGGGKRLTIPKSSVTPLRAACAGLGRAEVDQVRSPDPYRDHRVSVILEVPISSSHMRDISLTVHIVKLGPRLAVNDIGRTCTFLGELAADPGSSRADCWVAHHEFVRPSNEAAT